jgi:cyclopropane-fatty-acyl-phospholipid synthase
MQGILENISLKGAFADVFAACGITLNGSAPHDITFPDRWSEKKALELIIRHGSLGMGDGYVQGLWTSQDLPETLRHIIGGPFDGLARRSLPLLGHAVLSGLAVRAAGRWLSRRLFDYQSKSRQIRVAKEHYDTPVVFDFMLDKQHKGYTTGDFRDGAVTLEDAVTNKLVDVCDGLQLLERKSMFDSGCGFGGQLAFAVERYGVNRAFGYSNSEQHVSQAQERYAHLPQMDIHFLHYWEALSHLQGERFDAGSSIEVIEAIGPRHHREYMEINHAMLKPGGLFLLEAIMSGDPNIIIQDGNWWLDKHIFPGGTLISERQYTRSTSGLFLERNVRDLTPDYSKTIGMWRANLIENREQIMEHDPQFTQKSFGIYDFYLSLVEASLDERRIITHQKLLEAIPCR